VDCFRCEGKTRPVEKTHAVTLDDSVIIVKRVPALACGQCGEVYFSDEVMQNVETIIDKLESLIKEVAIVEYTAHVA
jgi:YgiT-type zinc finger domain-containing protein